MASITTSATPHSTDQEAPADTRQAAAFLGFKKNTLEIWRHRGIGPTHLKIGRGVRYDWSELRRFRSGCVRQSTGGK